MVKFINFYANVADLTIENRTALKFHAGTPIEIVGGASEGFHFA